LPGRHRKRAAQVNQHGGIRIAEHHRNFPSGGVTAGKSVRNPQAESLH
jgi:hypothetical protein